MAAIQLDDGLLQFGLPNGTSVSMDAFTAKLKIEPIEEKHGRFKEGFATTQPFLDDLCQAFVQMGVDPCTPSMAWAMWEAICNRLDEVKKNTSAPQKLPGSTD